MISLKQLSVIGTISLGLSLSGCQKTEPHTQAQKDSSTTNNAPVRTLSIGFQKSSLNFLIAKEQKIFEQEFPNAKIEWREFPAGPQMLEALAVGAVDFGMVGNTPPIFAQAADKDLSYVGYEVVPANSQALLIPVNSAFKSIQDLKGKRIAVQKGSSAHELLAKVLQKAGLSWQDIQPVWLPPADARAAFDKGAVDAWAIWEPYLSTTELKGHAKSLIDGTAFPTTYSFYIGNPKFIQQHPDATQKVLNGLNKADQWFVKHQDEGLSIYAQSTGLDTQVAKAVLDKRHKPSPVQPLTPEVTKAQQSIADLFQQVQLIPKGIQVNQTIWTPKAS
ncbi:MULTISPECIES: aliphatic sulfonate ABC transporter substrate-binding protein [unclassified Acinetobacter]|uniref:aliphatic sulfonate ABC transporter substrate-binding protein n=1 Tax=unclassified Acinetobacter TaxID=196816 RepID=UPI00190A70EE|nr:MULTISPECIES: aliphatic sulfonate ABC transporter substrate-binding protein [unclassified Acinetobacter]MBK0064305.1 aliphatic sulfonate ABC transporter substrate-binding protein [Acinetobacter sp. S55]MBK0067703.1 aliphatic sulfonate ABC transporter substrate-binding protein [Acinetobacter sp. S54]